MQTFIAILLVVACGGYVAWQLLRTIRAGNGKAGACCSHGCGGHDAATKLDPADASQSPASATPSTQFVSADSLRQRAGDRRSRLTAH